MTGSAAGSAMTGSAAGSAATVDPIAPSTDKLPDFDAVKPPLVSEQGPLPRSEKFFGLGGRDMVTAVFDELSPGNLGKKVYVNDEGAYVLIQLKSHNAPNIADFDKQADAIIAELRERRAASAVIDFLKNRCETLAKAGKIHPNTDLVREHDGSGNALPISYQPCQSFRPAPGAGFGGE
jgi:hypothetical protein